MEKRANESLAKGKQILRSFSRQCSAPPPNKTTTSSIRQRFGFDSTTHEDDDDAMDGDCDTTFDIIATLSVPIVDGIVTTTPLGRAMQEGKLYNSPSLSH